MMDYFLGIIKSLIIINKQFGWEFFVLAKLRLLREYSASIFVNELSLGRQHITAVIEHI